MKIYGLRFIFMAFHKRYNNLLSHLPPSIIQELWVRLTTRKNDLLSEAEASKINSKVEALIQHEIDKYNRKKDRQLLRNEANQKIAKYEKLVEHLYRVISERNKEIAKLKEELYEPIYLPSYDNPIYLSGLR